MHLKQNTEGLICKHEPKASKVNVGVYYEATNIEASTYLAKQLAAYFHALQEFVDIDLVPYGTTQYNETLNKHTCSMGEVQCISNKYQALVINSYINKPKNGDPISGTNRVVNFIACLARSTISNVYQALEQCTNQYLHADDYHTFIDHIIHNDDEIKHIYLEMHTKTLKVAQNGVLRRVPFVTINGLASYDALDDLVAATCAKYGVSISDNLSMSDKI